MQPEDPDEPKPPAEEPEEPKPDQDRDIDRSFWERNSVAIVLLFSQCVLWGILFTLKRGSSYVGLGSIILVVMLIAATTAKLISVARSGELVDIAIMLSVSFSALIVTFSSLYWAYGTTGNFTERLTRLDAIYFTVGTLATAGTGNISAVSQVARGLQTLQMVLDVGFTVFAVSLVVAEISSRIHGKRDRHNN